MASVVCVCVGGGKKQAITSFHLLKVVFDLTDML